jgi:hypothetical protein
MRFVLAAVMLTCLGLTGCVIYLNPSCADQIRNGDETGVDCGGGCGHCELGQGCRADGDCDSGLCGGSVCVPLPCDNGVKDAQETDVDCGGPTCRKCSGNRHCNADADCFSGTCTAGANTCSAITLAFADDVRLASGFKAYAMVPADLDGDGDPDVAIANEYGSAVAVFRNDYDKVGGSLNHLMNPAGTPKDDTFPNFPTGLYPTGIATADFNHDGHLDIVTADYHGNSISVLLNNGAGLLNLRPTATYPTVEGAETSNLAVGDLNKDGNPDVIATNPQRASVSLFLGHADGTFDPAVDLPVGIMGGSQPYSVAIGDFDGDGNNDVAIADDRSGTIVVRLGNGDATFKDEVAYEIGGVRDYIITTRDVNFDGKLDLVSANRGSDNVSVLLGRGDGTFRKSIGVSVRPMGAPKAKLFSPYFIAIADLNSDGVPDLITPNFMADSVSIMLGIGDGRFEEAIEVPLPDRDAMSPNTTPYGVAAGDFNHDGKTDFATCNVGSNDVLVKLNTGH